MSRFYIYLLKHPNQTVFYVGKGSGRRVFDHERMARGRCRCYKCNVIRKIWREGGEVIKDIVFRTDDEVVALDKERELIAFYGRDTLCNHTDGGEGTSNPSEEAKQKRRESIRKNTSYQSRLANFLRKMSADPQIKAKVKDKLKDFWTDEKREEQSQRIRQIFQDPDFRDRFRERMRRLMSSDEWKRKMLDGLSRHDRNQKSRRLSVALKARWTDPEYRAKMSAERAARFEDDEYRSRSRLLRLRENLSDETIRKMSNARRAKNQEVYRALYERFDLLEIGRDYSLGEIAKIVGRRNDVVHGILKRFVKEGKFLYPARGYYQRIL